jgi:hypothetical protein
LNKNWHQLLSIVSTSSLSHWIFILHHRFTPVPSITAETLALAFITLYCSLSRFVLTPYISAKSLSSITFCPRMINIVLSIFSVGIRLLFFIFKGGRILRYPE